jgi:hypothetical protein
MNRTRLISFIAIGLLITNLLMVGFIFLNKPQHPMHDGPKKIIAERLYFDAQQISDYDKLIVTHQRNINAKDSLIRQTKNELYGCISSNNVTLKDSFENKLGQLQIEIEEINYNHFLDIKKLCKENQLTYYNDLVKDLAQLFARPNQRPKH